MKVAICGSMQFGKDMIEIKDKLEELKYEVVLPKNIDQYVSEEKKVEDKWAKTEGDLFKSYFEEIKKSDAVLIVNITKNNVENYIGGNAFIEMAFAHILSKKIYLLNPIPRLNYTDEIEAMNPEILLGDLTRIHRE